MTTEEEQLCRLIDQMSYDHMLYLWRFEPVGSRWFQGFTGDYFAAKMKEKRAEIGAAAHSATSKQIGWDAPQSA